MNGCLLSILALYNQDNTLFDTMSLPEGITKEDLVDNLLLECSEFEVLYPDVDFMKMAIGAWSRKEISVWNRLYNTTQLEYNPLENYDRMENWTDSAEGTNYNRTESAGNQTGATARNDTVNSNGNSTLTVAGFNSSEWGNREKTDTSGTNVDNESINTSMGHTDDATSQGNNTHDSEHTGRVHGNIGVTTSQQMLEAEREVSKFNMIDYIITDFKTRFCLLIY